MTCKQEVWRYGNHFEYTLGDLVTSNYSFRHATILDRVGGQGLGKQTYDYVRNFLTGRKAKVTMGDLVSEKIEIGSADAPQGSVLSPMLFNLALIELPAKLQEIEGLNHTLYGDITLCVRNGRRGQIEQTLQTAVERYLGGRG